MNTDLLTCPVHKVFDFLCHHNDKNAGDEILLFPSLQNRREDWDAVAGYSGPLSSSCCQAFESSYSENIRPIYVLGYKNGLPVFCAMFQEIRITSDNIRKHKKEIHRIATNFLLNLYDLKILVCGNVFKDGVPGFTYNSNTVTEHEARELLIKIVKKVSDAECFAAVMLKDMPQGYGFRNENRVFSFDKDISMNLPVSADWTCLGDYQKALSKKYAARARKILASGENLQIRELEPDEIKNSSRKLSELYRQIIRNQSFVFGTLDENFFFNTRKVFGDQYQIKGIFLDQELIAFYSIFETSTELSVHYIGMNYDYNTSHNLYFNIHFAVLKEAIEKRKSILRMGRTSLEAKAILGCLPWYNNTQILFLNPLAEKAFFYFQSYLTESDNWKTRNPMKDSTSLEAA